MKNHSASCHRISTNVIFFLFFIFLTVREFLAGKTHWRASWSNLLFGGSVRALEPPTNEQLVSAENKWGILGSL